MDQPITPGDWTYIDDPVASRALFGPAGGATLFTVACERTKRQVRLWRAAAATGPVTMTITTTESVSTASAAAAPGGLPQVVADFAPYDPALDAMVFTRGRFAVQVPGAATLYLPSWPEVARVVEDCR